MMGIIANATKSILLMLLAHIITEEEVESKVSLRSSTTPCSSKSS